jgi:hypothetical protein
MDDRLLIRCSGCGDAFRLAIHLKADSGEGLMSHVNLGGNLDSWLNAHWPHISHETPLGEAFTLEDNKSMKEGEAVR